MYSAYTCEEKIRILGIDTEDGSYKLMMLTWVQKVGLSSKKAIQLPVSINLAGSNCPVSILDCKYSWLLFTLWHFPIATHVHVVLWVSYTLSAALLFGKLLLAMKPYYHNIMASLLTHQVQITHTHAQHNWVKLEMGGTGRSCMG